MSKDPYIISEENKTLKNKLNIDDYKTLNQAEADIGFLKLVDIDRYMDMETDEELLKTLHKHILGDVFEWAGKYRTIQIFKREYFYDNNYSVAYSIPEEIDARLSIELDKLNTTNWNTDDLVALSFDFARKIAKLWQVHPFRDGNTRTILSFAYIFAKKNGFSFDMEKFIANLNREYGDNDEVIKKSVRDGFVLACSDVYEFMDISVLANMFLDAFEIDEKESNKSIK